MPMPMMTRSLAGAAPPGDSMRMPQTLRSLSMTSLGHLMARLVDSSLRVSDCGFNSGASASQMATAVVSESRGQFAVVMP